ncbi:unnamed protein product [marine sediment metagenome]|uniref:Uncharacterized protein n=1 Tax=marine sediment metagenome TaxID=412755 RepID=X1LT61_9ZZZZ
MGSIRRLDSNVDIQAFPGAHFIINNDVPPAQCSEAQIEGDDATTTQTGLDRLTDPGKFAGYDLTGKVCTITASVGGNTGDFAILSNTDDTIAIEFPGEGDPVAYYVRDGGELILTRDQKSFAQFIHAAGYAYTIKGGRLFTNMPNGLLKEACTILWEPLK